MQKKKIVSLIAANALIFNLMGSNSFVKAEPIQSNISSNQSSDVTKQISALENQMEKTDNEIQNTMIEINKNTENINKINTYVKETSKEIWDREEILKDDELENNNTAKAIYENGGSIVTLLNIVIESKDFSDFIGKTTAVNKILAADKEVVKKVHEDKKYIENKQNKLLLNRVKVEKLLNSNKDKLDKLNQEKSRQTETLTKLNVLKATLSTASKNSANINVYSQGISTGHLIYGDNNIVNYAKNFLGVPYLWGGTSASGFDCSGFVQYVYAHFGVNLPRTTYEQVNVGTTVTGALEPGDLIFFGDTKAPHHVAMYIGNGEYIQAPHTGDFIKISPIADSGYSIAKRIK